MKVVVVDDNLDRNEIAAIERTEQVEITGFTSSLEALGYLADVDNAADVVILDLRLPVLDGLRLAREIRKNEEIHLGKTPVKMVFYTGQEVDDTIERVAKKVGVAKEYIIRKPYALGALVNTLKKKFYDQ